jgi:hypothetical protein
VNKAARGCLSVFLILGALVVVMVAGKIAAILLLVAGFYVLGVAAKAMPSLAGYAGLAANGIPARGILLQVNPVATSLQGGQIKVRQVLVDVEVPGQAPYEVSVSAMMPTNLSADVIPGATMELRLHPKNRTTIAIVGPGVGFAGGSLLAPGYPGGGPGSPGGPAGGGPS